MKFANGDEHFVVNLYGCCQVQIWNGKQQDLFYFNL